MSYFTFFYVSVYVRMVHNGAFGEIDMMFHFFRIIRRGFNEFNVYDTVHDVVGPVTILLLDVAIVPFFLARVVATYIVYDSYYYQTLVARYAYIVCLVAIAIVKLCLYGRHKIVGFYNFIRDSRHLVRAELANR